MSRRFAPTLVAALVVLIALLPAETAGADGDGAVEPLSAEAAIAVVLVEPASVAPLAEPAPALSMLEVQVLALVNGARTGRGLPPLQWDEDLAAAARAHAADMMRRGVVSHTGSDGSSPQDRLRRAGCSFASARRTSGRMGDRHQKQARRRCTLP